MTRRHAMRPPGGSGRRANGGIVAGVTALLLAASAVGPVPSVSVVAAAPPVVCPDLPLPHELDPAPVELGGGEWSLHCEYTIPDEAGAPTEHTVLIVAHWFERPTSHAATMCEENAREVEEGITTPQGFGVVDHAITLAWSALGPDAAWVQIPAYVPPAAGELAWGSLEQLAVRCSEVGGGSSGAGPSSTATAANTTTSAPAGGERKPLCSEAIALLEGFGEERLRAAGITDTTKTGIRIDGGELLADFRRSIRSFDAAHAEGGAYVSDGTPFAGEIGALNWLFSYGGAVGGAPARAYVTGHESDLQQRLVDRAERQGVDGEPDRLTPGEVLEEALELTGGDVNQALLASHNLMRGSARNDPDSAPGILMDSGRFIDTYLVRLRDGENGGPWYHLFGTAYMEVVAQGDWGPWIAAGGAAAAFSAGLLTGPAALALGGLALAWQNESDVSGTTNASRFANGMEQVVRETGFRERAGNRPDPEKYCFNVWGAQAGARLYEELPYRSTRSLRRVFGESIEDGDAGPARGIRDATHAAPLSDARHVSSVQSPFTVQWDEGTSSMVLDQGDGPATADLGGGVPGWLLPVYEGESWGVVWIEDLAAQPVVTLTATRDGAPLRFVRTDVTTGETAVYEATAAAAGDQFTVTLTGATVSPEMTGPDGQEVVPTVVTLDVAVPETDPAAGDEGGDGVEVVADAPAPGTGGGSALSGEVAIGLAGFAAGIVAAGVVVAVRRRRRVAVPAPDVPSA